ncbi:hypothetical protein CIK94_08275 [Prevotella sp. P4-51]|nr:hypothetical protein CIK95_11080 [Prevotella sp. P5-108]OYP71271.1 hypothetical protein CIK87_01560 [Prevotella sp. P5-64]OYP73340.1 hypothetical protein CIK94_08275 [Prevotella sp. P4-51]
MVILSPGQSHAASLQRQQRVAEQVGSRRPMVEVAAGVVIGDTNGHIISVEMKKMHGERKKTRKKIAISFFLFTFGHSFLIQEFCGATLCECVIKL